MTGALQEYADWMAARGLARRTVEQRLVFTARLLREWGTLDVSPTQAARFLEPHHGWTRKTYLNHLRSVFAWRVSVGALPACPLQAYRRPPQPAPKPDPLTREEWERAYDVADQRTRAWMQLARLAGLRAHEVAKFHGADIDARVIFVRGKGGREDRIPTHPDLWALAQLYPRHGYWFPSTHGAREHVHHSLVGNTIRAVFREAGIERGSVHRLRATFATDLLDAGASVPEIQRLLRHSSLATTEHYIGVDWTRLSAAVNRLAA